ncbi:hypothetical protein M9Y10_000784 [Tritrichomonas musculus]|uniref:Uncharacterized protein n=1 Tax=Tritrichomonas musculus TaxID=1915356 RepID=A0ABR2L560_9EUKA
MIFAIIYSLISFVKGNDFCIEKTPGKCKQICPNPPVDFDKTFNYFPNQDEVDPNDESHNIFIADEVEYYPNISRKNNIIPCDKAVSFIFEAPTSSITIDNNVEFGYEYLYSKIPLKIQFRSSLNIDIKSIHQDVSPSIILEAIKPDLSLTLRFLTEDIQDDFISISEKSQIIKIADKTELVKRFITESDKLEEIQKNYFCISDKNEKCKDYSQFSPLIVKSTLQVNKFPAVVIIETSIPQFYAVNFNKKYTHFICSPNSTLTYQPLWEGYYSFGSFYVIFHENYIEMANCTYEGKGSFKLVTPSTISLHTTANDNNFDFTLKSGNPQSETDSEIYCLSWDKELVFENKIKAAEKSLFHGADILNGLFEEGTFVKASVFNRYVTPETLKEYPFVFHYYNFEKGDHVIPTTWKTYGIFKGYSSTESENSFTFNDVHSIESNKIDNYMWYQDCGTVTINPSHFMSWRPSFSTKVIINVDGQVIINRLRNDDFEIDSKEKCQIIGDGTVKFVEEDFMEKINSSCEIGPNVSIELLNEPYPTVYVCIGQSDLEKCKSEIEGIDSIQNVEWIWLRNIETLETIYNYSRVYVTDEQSHSGYYRIKDDEIILTANAHLEVRSSYVTVKKNGFGKILAQKKTAKLTIMVFDSSSVIYQHDIKNFELFIEEFPTEIDFEVFFYYDNVKLLMYYRDEFLPGTIKTSGSSIVNIREPFVSMLSMFKKSDTLSFVINPESDYQLCYADEPKDCDGLNDFVLATNIDEFIEYDSCSFNSIVYLRKNTSLTVNSNNYINHKYFCNDNILISFDLPNNAIIYFDYDAVKIITDESYSFYANSTNNVKFIFDIKDYLTLDCYFYYLAYSFEFTSSKTTTEIIPNQLIRKINIENKIKMHENFSITSPTPQYIKNLFDCPILLSSRWTYLYLNEEGKNLYQSTPSLSFYDYQNDDDISENIVLLNGMNTNLELPQNWTKNHNIYLLQDNYELTINTPFTLKYLKDGVVLNNNFKVIHGNIDIIASESFSLNAELPKGYGFTSDMYESRIYCYQNLHTTINIGYLNSNEDSLSKRYVKIYGYNSTNSLTIKLKNEADLYDFNVITYLSDGDAVKYDFGYDYICYCSIDDISSKCSGKFYHASDITSFLSVVRENPEMVIYLHKDLIIPYPTGDHFILNPSNDQIKISLLDSPKSVTVSENDKILIEYIDSTKVEILSKAIIDIAAKKSIELNIQATTQSDISLSLEANVLISSESEIAACFPISVNKNGFHLYAHQIDTFKNIFGDSVELYKPVCAYQLDSDSHCSFENRKTINEVFVEPFEYNEVEIAPISSPINIDLPSIDTTIDVNILPSSTSILSIGSISSLSINPKTSFVNNNWKFIGDNSILSYKFDSVSSLSVPEIISTPISIQLTNNESRIDLLRCANQSSKQITIIKYGDTPNEITVFGSLENYNNFIDAILQHDGIEIKRNGTRKYICICDDDESYERCVEVIDGIFEKSSELLTDPGDDVDIRFFKNLEISSNLLTYNHNTLIDSNCSINITDVKNVYLNIEDQFKVDNLVFENGSNLLLKPKDPVLNISLHSGEIGQNISIEIDTFLKLNIPNIEDENLNASWLHVSGKGELNIYDYPFSRVIANSKVKVIKGVYTICNSKAGNSVCSYDTAEGYRTFGNSYDFRDDFDPNSKIVVFLDSFTSSVDVNIHYLKGQKIQFMKKPNSAKLLENPNKLRFVSTTELNCKSDETIELAGSTGGAYFDNEDSNLVIVGFNDTIVLKQENSATPKSNITLQPLSENVTIDISELVDLENQKFIIENEEEKDILVSVVSNNIISNQNEISNIFYSNSQKVQIKIESPNDHSSGEEEKLSSAEIDDHTIPEIIEHSSQELTETTSTANDKQFSPSKKNLSTGAIIGIVVGVIVVVCAAVALTIILCKKKDNLKYITDSFNEDDSIGF